MALGTEAVVEATGLREPCSQIDKHLRGLRAACTATHGERFYVKGGLMAVVVTSGIVRPGDVVCVIEEPDPFVALPVL